MDKLIVATHDYNLTLWANRIKECRTSGLTVNKWYEQNNIGLKNYYYWMRKIKREAFDALSAERKEIPSTIDSTAPVFSKISLSADNRTISTAAVTIQLNGIDRCKGWCFRNGYSEYIACYPQLMFGDISQAESIYLACGYTDMRKSIDGLSALEQ